MVIVNNIIDYYSYLINIAKKINNIKVVQSNYTKKPEV